MPCWLDDFLLITQATCIRFSGNDWNLSPDARLYCRQQEPTWIDSSYMAIVEPLMPCPPHKTLAFNMALPLSFLPQKAQGLYWKPTLLLEVVSWQCHKLTSWKQQAGERLHAGQARRAIQQWCVYCHVTRIPRNAETSDSFYFSGAQRGQQDLNIT